MKKRIAILAIIAAMMILPYKASAQIYGPISYVAIGDSLAAGQTPNREIDAGYTDLIAQEIGRNQRLAFYSKNLAFPGYTTADVLKRIQSNDAKVLLKKANIITISAGANDLLRLVKPDAKSGSLSYQQIPVDYSLNGVRKNMKAILSELKISAPNAHVYVMGYYFAYPHARELQKKGTAKQLDLLNEILAKTANESGASFVSVDDSFGSSAKDKVPNPSDVHPNSEGYRAMANSFFSVYANGAMQVRPSEVPPANPLTFEEIMKVQKAATGDRTAVLPSAFLKEKYLAVTKPRPFI